MSITKEVLFAVVVRLSCQQKEASSPRPITEAFVTAVVIMLTSTAVEVVAPVEHRLALASLPRPLSGRGVQ